MGDVVPLRPDPDQQLAAAWEAMIRAHRVAIATPSIRNMVRCTRAYEAWLVLTVPDEAARRELLR